MRVVIVNMHVFAWTYLCHMTIGLHSYVHTVCVIGLYMASSSVGI